MIQRFCFIVFLCLLVALCQAEDKKKNFSERKISSEEELWTEYTNAYDQKDIDKKKFLVQNYPAWADSFARRLITSYLSYTLKDKRDVADRMLHVIKDIAQVYEQVFATPYLLQQANFYESLNLKSKKKALEAIIVFFQAQTSKNAMYLFDITTSHQKELDSDKISDELKKEFIKNNRPLSEKSILAAKNLTKEWLIQDPGEDITKKYLLISIQDKIVVYQIELYQQALALYRQIDDYWSIADILTQLGQQSLSQGEMDQAIHWLQESLEFFEKLKDYVNLAKTYNSLGLITCSQKEFKKADEHYHKGLEIARIVENLPAMASLCNNLGALNKILAKYNDAKKFFEESLVFYRTIQDQSGIATVLNNLGTIAFLEKDYDKANRYLEESLALTSMLKDGSGVAHTFKILASVATNQKRYLRAQVCLEESLDILKSLKDSSNINMTDDELKRLKDKYTPAQNDKEYYHEKLRFAKLTKNITGIRDSENKIIEIEKSEKKRMTILIVTFFSLVLASLGYVAWKARKKR